MSPAIFTFATIYYFAPDVHEQLPVLAYTRIVPGLAVRATASPRLRIYLHFFNGDTRVNGSVGAVIIVMLRFWVAGLAYLISGQINPAVEHAAANHDHIEARVPGEEATVPTRPRA